MASRRSHWVSLALIWSLASTTPSSAKTASASASSALLVIRVMAYNRNLVADPAPRFRLVVVHPDGALLANGPCAQMLGALKGAAAKFTVAERPLVVEALAWRDEATLNSTLESLRPGAVYVCSGLRDQVSQIAAATRKQRMLSFAANIADVERGLSIAFAQSAERRRPVVSLRNARAEGAALDAAFLSLAEIQP